MKPVNTILKILTALAAVAGAVYIIATYGEQIVDWCKKIWNAMPKCPGCEEDGEIEVEFVTETEEPAAEEAPAEEAPAEEAPVVEVAPAEEPAPEVVVAENEPVAAEEDFAE